MADLAEAVRRYLEQPHARHMSHHQAAQVEEHLSPLERALAPARH